MQVDLEQPHDGEGDGQYHGDRKHHDQPGTPFQRQERHRQHDDHGFEKARHEEVDRTAHNAGLVVDLLDLQPYREGLFQ